MKSIVLWADVVSSTTVFGCLLSVGFIPFQIAAGHRKLNPNATISDKKRLFIACIAFNLYGGSFLDSFLWHSKKCEKQSFN